MLAKLHVEYVIVGHSERRRLFGETDEIVAAKLKAVLRNGMTPICCVGETLEEREAGLTRDRLAGQVEAALAGVPSEAVGRHGHRLRAALGHRHRAGGHARGRPGRLPVDPRGGGPVRRPEAAGQVRVQYGGSVTEENTESPAGRCPDVDGALVGGASLDAAAFVAIIRAAARAVR